MTKEQQLKHLQSLDESCQAMYDALMEHLPMTDGKAQAALIEMRFCQKLVIQQLKANVQ